MRESGALLSDDGLTGSYSGPDLGSQRTRHIQFGRRPLRRLHRVSAERERTPEVHGKKNLSKHMLFQSVRLVGAVGIEIASLLHKDLHGNELAPPPIFQLLSNVVKTSVPINHQHYVPIPIAASVVVFSCHHRIVRSGGLYRRIED